MMLTAEYVTLQLAQHKTRDNLHKAKILAQVQHAVQESATPSRRTGFLSSFVNLWPFGALFRQPCIDC